MKNKNFINDWEKITSRLIYYKKSYQREVEGSLALVVSFDWLKETVEAPNGKMVSSLVFGMDKRASVTLSRCAVPMDATSVAFATESR